MLYKLIDDAAFHVLCTQLVGYHCATAYLPIRTHRAATLTHKQIHTKNQAQPAPEDMIGLPMELMDMLKAKCESFFTAPAELGWPSQVLVNEYRNNQGIASHFEDFEAFGDIILTISLINPLYMTLKKPVERTNACSEYLDVQKVLLEPGSLLVMQGACYSLLPKPKTRQCCWTLPALTVSARCDTPLESSIEFSS